MVRVGAAIISSPMESFTCRTCGSSFSLPDHVLDRYPGWEPTQCMDCRGNAKNAAKPGSKRGSTKKRAKSVSATRTLTTDEVLGMFTDGPTSGVFTDGSSVPNPGPGGWGAVYVVDNEIIDSLSGADPDTTNNRMELTAIIAALEIVPQGTPATIYTDSRLAVQTLTEWATGWEKRGWKRKSGPVENLDLVKRAYYAINERPEISIEWIAAHSGYRWNEYADALASSWRS